MIRLTIFFITMLISLSVTSSFGSEWSVTWSGAGERVQQLDMASDKDYQFAMDRFLCKASKLTIANIQDEVFERRTVACQVSKNTYVSTELSFNTNGKTCTDTQALTIYDKDKIYIARLAVMCK